MYEEEILEAVLPIRYGQPHNTVRQASIDFARAWCETIGHGLHEACRLEFLSPDSYYLRCKPEHMEVPIVGFAFGSFRNYGVFDDHFRMNGYENSKPICVDFEHDSKKMDLYFMYPTQALAVPNTKHGQRNGNGPRQQPQPTNVILMNR